MPTLTCASDLGEAPVKKNPTSAANTRYLNIFMTLPSDVHSYRHYAFLLWPPRGTKSVHKNTLQTEVSIPALFPTSKAHPLTKWPATPLQLLIDLCLESTRLARSDVS